MKKKIINRSILSEGKSIFSFLLKKKSSWLFSSDKMSIVPPLGVRGYLFQQQTPQVSKKKRYLFQLVESFFLWTSGGVAVTDSHPEPGSEEERREEGTGAYHGTVTQKVSPAFFSGVFLDLGQPKCANRDGWRLSNRQNTSGGGFFRTIFFQL